MKPFLIDNDKVYTYQDLLDAIQTDGFYYPYYKVHDVFLYFVNLVKALANNQSLVLLDSDLNSSEIENLNESLVNQPRIINTLSFSDISEVINAVKKSGGRDNNIYFRYNRPAQESPPFYFISYSISKNR